MKLHIDSDTGLDDAMALVHGMLDQDMEIVSITTVHGNGGVDDCTAHALELTELMGANTPVVQGAAGPIIDGCGPAPQVHGKFARGGLPPASVSRRKTEGYAANYLIDQARRYGHDLTIVAMGRLTNLALAYLLDPAVMNSIRQIYWTGGSISVPGNVRAVTEANLDGDPEAARVLFNSGAPLTILPLDVTMRALVTAEDVARMATSRIPGVLHLSRILPYYLDFYESILGVRAAAAHCGLLLSIAADETLIAKSHRLPVDVELGGNFTRGMLVVDRRSLRADTPTEQPGTRTRVIFDADVDRYLSEFRAALRIDQ